jgi:aspartate/methionine/tyrosine aminotransferase
MDAVSIVHYPLVYDGKWAIDLGGLRATITGRTRAIVLVNPNNPTGSFVKRRELDLLIELCRKRRLALIADEVFSDYALRPDPERVPSLAEGQPVLSFSMSGLSKIAGLPQLKLGWIVVSGPEALREEAFEKLELIADTYLSVGTPVQRGASRLLESGLMVRRQISARTRQNLSFLEEHTAASSCRVLNAEGGWYATLQMPRTRSEEEWVLELLGEDNVVVQPGFFFDFDSEAFLILSLLTPPAVFQEGIGRLLARAAR